MLCPHFRFLIVVAIFTEVNAAELCRADEVDIPQKNHAISAMDHRIRYQGRWDRTNSASPWCAWQGSSFRLRFEGTAIAADIDGGARDEYIRVILNGNSTQSKKIKIPKGRKKITLASDLPLGVHDIEIVKESYTGRGRMSLFGFEIVGKGLLELPKRKPRLQIEFYGDSNLAGYSLEHERNKSGAQYVGCHFTYAGIVARMLDAEYQNISSSGAVISGKRNSVLSFFDRVDFYEPEPKWDFEKLPADVCVLNIGANDINSKRKEQIKQDYKELIEKIRCAHPNAFIVLMNGYGWDRKEPANYTDEVIEEIGDPKLSRLLFPWFFNEWHGCEYDHGGMAAALVQHLAKLNTDWKPVRNADVMNGFGTNGQIANGSFEQVAPFGGFGWRYFQDGAKRIHDPKESPEGEWYLRLPEGKQVHQPNSVPRPANKTKFTYRLKMRSVKTKGQAKIRFEFRDQKWRNEIPDTSIEKIVDLDSNWRDFDVIVPVPSNSEMPDPSFQPWQVIVRIMAVSGDVHIDAVQRNLTEG